MAGLISNSNYCLRLQPSWKYDLDLAAVLIDERDLLFDDDVAEATNSRRHLLRLRRKRMNLDVRRHNGIDGNGKIPARQWRASRRNHLRDFGFLLQRQRFGLCGRLRLSCNARDGELQDCNHS